MGVFSRLSDIINSNINAILDKAEDPEKLVRMIIQEMEQTLIEVRTASAKTIADKKELTRHLSVIKQDISDWEKKAELAVSKERDDLAAAALKEKARLTSMLTAQEKELEQLDAALEKLEFDISRLQTKHNEAVARRDAMILRQQTLEKQKAVKLKTYQPNLDNAFEKFEAFERKMDLAEAEIEALDLGQSKSLKQQIEDLSLDEDLSKELTELKKRVANE
ncbi:MAG: phage shock protein PspA [Kangiellaceae bacterium]|jgi:phage shock protein A|nr:phage shock protein PspA [Kangiellaceae bacterium]